MTQENILDFDKNKSLPVSNYDRKKLIPHFAVIPENSVVELL
jgi:hypothetical protein